MFIESINPKNISVIFHNTFALVITPKNKIITVHIFKIKTFFIFIKNCKVKSATVTRTDVCGFVEGSVNGGCGRLRCQDQVIEITGLGRPW